MYMLYIFHRFNSVVLVVALQCLISSYTLTAGLPACSVVMAARERISHENGQKLEISPTYGQLYMWDGWNYG